MRPIAIAALVVLAPTTTWAANQMRPRTAAIFEDTPCIMTVDKAVDDPRLHFEYAVGFDDIDLTEEELLDSRTMQFLAFAEQRWNFALPNWINQSDFDRAEANGDITGMIPYTDDDILEKTTLWSPDAWVRITPDDARVPITMDQAAMGFDWDITDVHVGSWMIAAYTFEPELNKWSVRQGAVRIEDSSTPDAQPGPTVFLQDAESQLAEVDVPYAVTGCIHAEAGSTYTASYGPIEGIGEPMWMPFVTNASVVNGELALDFVPDEMANDSSIKVRVEVTEPSGGSFTAYNPQPIEVTCPDCGESSGGETTGDPTDTSTSDDGDTTPQGEDDEGGGFGFGCRAGSPTPPAAMLLLLLVGLGLVNPARRRSSATRGGRRPRRL
jgi:hypothetical protein